MNGDDMIKDSLNKESNNLKEIDNLNKESNILNGDDMINDMINAYALSHPAV